MALQTNHTDFEVRSLDAVCVNDSELKHPFWYNLKYTLAGLLFGIILIKSEVISWLRIQEMFRFQSLHMYGVIGSAVVVGIISVWIIKKWKIKTIYGEPILFATKTREGTITKAIIFQSGRSPGCSGFLTSNSL